MGKISLSKKEHQQIMRTIRIGKEAGKRLRSFFKAIEKGVTKQCK